MKFIKTYFVAAVLLLGTAVLAEAPAVVGDPYPLATDPVSGAALGATPVIQNHEGRELRFTDSQSYEQFKKDSAAVLKKLDEQLVVQQLKTYPLEICPISKEKLGSMGKPVDLIVSNRLVRLCCSGCVKPALGAKAADAYAKIDAAVIEQQLPKYAAAKCVVSGDPIDKDSINYVIGTRLVRLCCKACIDDLKKDPSRYLTKLEAPAATP